MFLAVSALAFLAQSLASFLTLKEVSDLNGAAFRIEER